METEKSAKTTVHLDLDADDLEARGQLVQLRCDTAAITLDDMLLVEDDAPGIGKPEDAADNSWFEKLHKDVMIRKDLVLDDARAFAGYLLFNGMEAESNDFPLHIRINGVELVRPPTKLAHPFARHYYTSDWDGAHFDNWFVIEVPVGALRQGNNEIVLWAESTETSWEIMVAADSEYRRGSDWRRRHPNRSAKSRDGGATWDFDHLGWKDEIDGEYALRLSLDRNVPEGKYASPVIDLAAAEGSLKKLLEIEECRVEWDVDIPEECSAEIRVRSGEYPRPSAYSWSNFEQVDKLTKKWSKPAGRYLQFEVVMRTENPLKTPALKGVSIETVVAKPPRTSRVLCRMVEFKSGQVTRPSMEFAHEDFARLQDIRVRFELEKVVEGAASEFEAQLRLMRWAYEVPLGNLNPYAWNYSDLPQLERDEEGRIKLLGGYEKRRREGHCLYCNLTLIAACLAMGYPARWVNVSTKHTYGHEVTEVWSNEFDKWVFLDATLDYYIYDPDSGIPLNLVEISQRLAEIMPGPATWEHPIQWHLPDPAALDAVRIACREGANNHTVWGLDDAVGNLYFKGHLQMPLRNDFASRSTPVPWRLTSNWGSDLFCCYYSDKFPRKREYRHHTNRPQDFNPPLNQAELFLSETQEAEILRVDIDTETPCFESFVVQVDEGDWRENPEPGLDWRLHEGLNRLRVKARNTMGVCGPESFAVVVMND